MCNYKNGVIDLSILSDTCHIFVLRAFKHIGSIFWNIKLIFANHNYLLFGITRSYTSYCSLPIDWSVCSLSSHIPSLDTLFCCFNDGIFSFTSTNIYWAANACTLGGNPKDVRSLLFQIIIIMLEARDPTSGSIAA